MVKLISLGEYYKLIGKGMYPDWSDDTIKYHSENKKDFKGFRARAIAVLSKATNQIWHDGTVLVAHRLEQGYLQPNFAIEDFDFFNSYCFDKNGNKYHCKLELSNKQKQGAPIKYNWMFSYIQKYAEENYSLEARNSGQIPADAIFFYLKEIAKKEARDQPSESSIRRYIKKLYPKPE